MENLALHIEYLLLRHDCVVVPGIGAFINIYEAPSFDPNTGMISPMRREVRFNSALRADDGMLANSYARKMGVSYREGSEMAGRAVSMLASALRLDGEITIGRLGIISQEEEGNLRFRPFKTAEQLCEDMGLIPVNFRGVSPSAEESAVVSVEDTEETTDTESFDVIDNISEDDAERVRRMDFNRNWYIPVNKIFAKVCACLALIIAIGLISLNPSNDTRHIEDKASVLPIDKIIDTAVQTTRTLTESSSKAETKEITTEMDEELPYHLIVATFASCTEAELYAEANKGRGYELEVLPSRKFCRVSAKSSADKNTLLEELNSATFKNTFTEGWILEE